VSFFSMMGFQGGDHELKKNLAQQQQFQEISRPPHIVEMRWFFGFVVAVEKGLESVCAQQR
jgi:hypothetical protein